MIKLPREYGYFEHATFSRLRHPKNTALIPSSQLQRHRWLRIFPNHFFRVGETLFPLHSSGLIFWPPHFSKSVNFYGIPRLDSGVVYPSLITCSTIFCRWTYVEWVNCFWTSPETCYSWYWYCTSTDPVVHSELVLLIPLQQDSNDA